MPNSPATSQTPGSLGATVNPAIAARVRQLAAQAEHHRAVAEYRAHHATDQQERINAMLDALIDALASLFGIQRS